MPIEITMPQLSDTMTEGTVVKWNKREGDKVKAGDEIADVETDKATMPYEAAEAGTLAHVAVKEGDKVAVGALIAVLATGSENAADVKKQYAGGAKSAAPAAANKASQPRDATGASERAPAKQAATAAPRGSAKAASAPAPVAPRVPPPATHHGAVHTLEAASVGELHEPDEIGHGATREPPTAVPPVPQRQGGGNGNGSGGRIFASPLARRVAAERNIDLNQLAGKGSGPRGRIVQADVLSFSDRAPPPARRKDDPQPAGNAPATPARVARGDTEVIPLTKMRAAIAAGLQRSKQTVPHFYETVDVDVEAIASLRAKLNEQLKSENVKLSVSDFVYKAVAAALLKHPAVNAHFNAERGEITRHGDVNLGIAVAVPDGLIVPVMRGVDQMGLREIRVRSTDLVKRAQALRLKQDELRGATFTISNLGMYGIREFSAIINPPEVGILAVGTAEKRAVVRDDSIVARTMMTLTLSADHRAVDGAVAAEFLSTLKSMLEEPAMMLV
jgi:pyruvate dehydrogenase E2 component (dihydrolipoamide acetyltransferase)